MTLNLDETERAARALLDSRINSVRTLVTARQRLTDLREEVTEAEREDVRLYNAALHDGWSAEELKKLGIAAPDKVTRTRRRATTGPGRGTKSLPVASGPAGGQDDVADGDA